MGSCSSQGDIIIHLIHPNIIFAPLPVIDYVLVHELAHIKHFNHSKNLWNYVGLILPDYQKHKDWLKKSDPTLTDKMSLYMKKVVPYYRKSTSENCFRSAFVC